MLKMIVCEVLTENAALRMQAKRRSCCSILGSMGSTYISLVSVCILTLNLPVLEVRFVDFSSWERRLQGEKNSVKYGGIPMI